MFTQELSTTCKRKTCKRQKKLFKDQKQQKRDKSPELKLGRPEISAGGKRASHFLCFLFPPSGFHFSVSPFLLSGLSGLFLVFCFNFFIVFLTVSLCITSLVIAPGVILYYTQLAFHSLLRIVLYHFTCITETLLPVRPLYPHPSCGHLI